MPRGANPITLTGSAHLVAKIGSHKIGVPIAGNSGLTVSGDGTVELSAPNPFTGDTNVNSGTLRLAGAATIAGSANIRVQR